ncbi:enoyl-CoA hydratase-related protein [Hydrogenophaga sp.]|uniref:enoyl-CoA hydratase-related protein n=1 Tax=Hydrogenophaga sp. TaxID=1904254 RepID=UPI00271D78BF|nr:enoyl-CoA hydratase-related protein [Hydrogenophaga sp.]MDO9434671.1 enoyl-CoA hydratase-related protein [Hydrogenophaga sp.]
MSAHPAGSPLSATPILDDSRLSSEGQSMNTALDTTLKTTLSTPGIHAQVDDGIALLTIDLPGQSANTMSVAFKEELRTVVERLEQAQGLRGIVITSGKKTFFAGGDLRTLIAVQPAQAPSFFDGLEWFKQTLRRLERLPIPVAVAINGAALGGGWEICLCAHARFCLADERIPLGLPEATLGLLPGAGGVNRMTRLLGLQRALPLLMDGRSFSPAKAQATGLLQGTAPDMAAVIALAHQWVLEHPHPVVPWDQPGFEVPDLRRDLPQVLRSAALHVIARDHGRDPARQAILAAAVEGACQDIDTALRIETRYLTSLATQQVAKNMIQTVFFDAADIRNGKGRPADGPRTELGTIGVDERLPDASALAQLHAAKRLSTGLRNDDTAASDGLLLTVADSPLRPPGTPCAVVLPALSSAGKLDLPALRFAPDVQGSLVEIVFTAQMPDTDVALIYDYVQRIGKTPLLVCDAGEGYVARLGRAAAHEAGTLRQQGASDALIENASLQTDLAQGPLSLAERFGVALPVWQTGAEPLPTVREIQDRILFAVALEAARCLETRRIASVREANIGSLLGIGFPRWTGGALQYIQQYGIARFVQSADALAARLGDRFTPCALLRELAARNAVRIEAPQ